MQYFKKEFRSTGYSEERPFNWNLKQDGFLVELGNFRLNIKLICLKARDCYTLMIGISSEIQLFENSFKFLNICNKAERGWNSENAANT